MMSLEPPAQQTGSVASAARMRWLRGQSNRVGILGRCQACHEQLVTGEPLVRCGPRRYICGNCSNANRPFTCRNCRQVITGWFGFRVSFPPKSAVICVSCRGKSSRKGLPDRCCGCRRTIPAGAALVVINRRRICRQCADAIRPFYCKRCRRTTTGEFVYLHAYVGNQRNPVCGECSAELEAIT